MTISSGPIRFLRSASRNSATVFASTPALRAPREAVRAVVLAVLRAFCWRPRACPPFLAAAVRLADDERALEDFALVERLLPDDLPADALLPDDRLPDALLPDDDLLRELAEERLRLDADRLPDPPDFALRDPPLLRRSAMLAPPRDPAVCVLVLTPWRGTIPPRTRR
jgi:hypothetical protein